MEQSDPPFRASIDFAKRSTDRAFDARQFDAAIERDINAGKLDAHAEEALAAHRAGRSRDL